MDSMFKIECNGAFRAGRSLALLSSMLSHNIQHVDLSLVTTDGVTIPANRGLLALHSKYLAQVLSSVPCCSAPAVSLPFTSVVVKNLLAVISCGVSLPLRGEELLTVKVAADALGISLGQLEVEKSEAKVQKKAAKKRRKGAEAEGAPLSVSPPPYAQNDNAGDSDEVLEITPEIFHDDEEGYAPHFLMQGMAEYEDEPSSAVSSPMSGAGAGGWNTQAGPQLIEVEPELGGDGEKKFKCSFCPNKVFKKKPEVMRHFKKHIPLSQRKRFQCESCKEKFISNSNLKTHLKVCTGKAKTYTCKRCKNEFDNKTDYEDHMAEVHNVGRNHECHICHKQLRRAGDVRKHMLTHSDAKPYACDICGKQFRTESYVKVHKEAHYKNGTATTPIKKVPEEAEPDFETENVYNENDDFDHEGNETNIDEDEDFVGMEDGNDNKTEVAELNNDEKLNYSLNHSFEGGMNQDDFIEDATAARVI